MESPLIDVDDLAALGPGKVTLLDVRWRLGGPAGREEFERGHLPGARFVNLEADLAGPPGDAGRHPLPAPERFEQAMRANGVRGDRPVVVYDDWSGQAAARAWWLLRHHGHADVRVLDGGWTAWRSARPDDVESGPEAEIEQGDFVAVPGVMPVVGAEGVAHVGVLIDARAPERYRGETEPLDPVAGHIPGAVNVPASGNVDERGRFLSPARLRARYAEAGARAGDDVAAYCGSGVTACHDVLAMAVAGVPAALYPGSWSEWCADPSRPVATGAAGP